MRRLLPLVAVALVTAGGATGASADKVVTSPGQVLALARSVSPRLDLGTRERSLRLDRRPLEPASTTGRTPLGTRTRRRCCEPRRERRNGSSLSPGTVSLWLAYDGGNRRDWHPVHGDVDEPEPSAQLESRNSTPTRRRRSCSASRSASVIPLLDRVDCQGAAGERREGVHLAGAGAGDEHDRLPGTGGRVREGREVLRPLARRRGDRDVHVPRRSRCRNSPSPASGSSCSCPEARSRSTMDRR